MLNRWYLCTAIVALLCLLTWSCVSSTDQTTNASKPQATASPASATHTSASPTPSKTTVDFGRYATANSFKLNTLPTTPYGPAWADISLEKSNFLDCKGASIALCYYSGP